jgi:hypothetical protein
MVKSHRTRSSRRTRRLTLPELEHSKTAVLNSLGSKQSRRSYEHAIDEFIAWYCSEPRLALNRTVVLRYRIHLESVPLAPATINLRLAAVRRIAYEAADTGLLSPELVAGIRRVKGLKRAEVVILITRFRPRTLVALHHCLQVGSKAVKSADHLACTRKILCARQPFGFVH